MAGTTKPTKRGLTNIELGIEPVSEPIVQSPVSSELSIVSIVSFGSKTITVKMSDGNTYRRDNGTLAWRYNNPGNLKYTSLSKQNGAIGAGDGNHSVFPTKKIGTEAQKRLLFRPEGSYYNKTIEQAINLYAPSSDGNKPKSYAAFVATKTGVKTSTKLMALSESQKNKLVEAMQEYEGWKEGTVTKL